MKNFDLTDVMDAPRVAWCAICDGPADVDEEGRCITCRDNGDAHDVEAVIPEGVPPGSPRSIECSLCGADIGEYCHPGEDGGGYNHSQRVDEHEEEHGIIAARPWVKS